MQVPERLFWGFYAFLSFVSGLRRHNFVSNKRYDDGYGKFCLVATGAEMVCDGGCCCVECCFARYALFAFVHGVCAA